MSIPDISITSLAASELDTDVLVLGATRVDDRGRLLVPPGFDAEVEAAIENMFEAFGFGAKKDELVRLPAPAGIRSPVVVVIGFGTGDPNSESLRFAAGTAGRRVRGLPKMGIAFPATDANEVRAILEGAAMGSYSYTTYRVKSLDAKLLGAQTIALSTTLAGDSAASSDVHAAVSAASATARAVALTRDLVNEPALDLYPSSFVDKVVSAADGVPVSLKVWNVDELAEGGFGGILGVGQGSTRGPRLVRVSYEPSGAAKHLALVGKGITFDSGGLSLKPPASMIGMKNDMTGAATVLATVLAAASLGLNVRVTAWLCLAENMPSGAAIRPGDVLSIYGGRTVEVLNTDAEGRLVLADGLVIASEEHPDAIIDVATLTGAQVTALGNRYVGTMGDSELVASVLASARAVGETLWHMPLPAELRPLLNSDIADLQNMKPGNTAGGMLIAAIFLREFVGDKADGSGPIPWAHLDIAGPAVNGGEGYGYTPKGPTGVTVRTLLDVAEKLAAAQA
ncbi:leucyl aminopeptidase [Subtercola endophyticus]|uniref:leucyl aminopeptidase n=1 Tax=Subtercola endophyticus TaxID=2895559 RepID=UPI001E46A9ED|nr:leucyl aminopeptidase [Subtercola endophyticus]UFS60212.1 leucyl aminopeptidase [Subtercola endophyticus]